MYIYTFEQAELERAGCSWRRFLVILPHWRFHSKGSKLLFFFVFSFGLCLDYLVQMERSFVHVVHQLQHNLSNFDYEPSFEVDNVVRKLEPLLLLCSGTHEHMLKLEPLLISSIKKHALKAGVDFIVSRTKIRNTNKYVTLSCAFRYKWFKWIGVC